MTGRLGLLLFVISALCSLSQAYENCGNGYYCNTGTCCGYGECCTYFYTLWYFWVIILVVFVLKVSCITCYVRRRRRQAAMYYVSTAVPQPTHCVQRQNGQGMPPPAYPVANQYLPPPPSYPGASVPVLPPQNQGTVDSTVERDTKMLIA